MRMWHKTVAHRLGALTAVHRWRNRQTLTVIAFHRILPKSERDSTEADPLYTITTELLGDILEFAHRYYNFVDLPAVLAARRGVAPLPPWALLVTFDDGWRDNYDFALPILQRHGATAAVFPASDAITDQRTSWWQEVVLWALRTARATYEELWRSAAGTLKSPQPKNRDELRLLQRYSTLDPGVRDEILGPLSRELESRLTRRQMLDAGSLQALSATNIAIGIHGDIHLPLTALADPSGDLDRARARIAKLLGVKEITSLSFPHGRYDDEIVDTARQLGMELMFTSDAVINPCAHGNLDTDLIGRIPMYADQISGADERLSAPRLAIWLFLHPRQKLQVLGSRPISMSIGTHA